MLPDRGSLPRIRAREPGPGGGGRRTARTVCLRLPGSAASESLIFLLPLSAQNQRHDESEKNLAADSAAARGGPGAQDLGEDPHAPRRGDHGLPRLVPAALYREQRRRLRHAHRNFGRLRLGQIAAGHFPHRHGGRPRLAARVPSPQPQGYAAGRHDRTGPDHRRSAGQHSRQRLLRIDLHGIDPLYGCAVRRTLRRIHDGQGGGHVLLPALPVEQRAAPVALPGRQQQLLLRGDLQSGRRIHLRSGCLYASVSV